MRHGEYVRHLIVTPPDVQHGSRKIFLNQVLDFKGFYISPYDLGYVGYHKNKLNQLKRNYWNEESLAFAKSEWDSHIDKKDYSVGWHTHGAQKSGTNSQKGFCLQAMTLVRNRDEVRLNVFYRTVEIVKKFYADLYFIQQHVLPYFGVKPNRVFFYFSSVTINNLYLPLIMRFIVDHKEIFKQCKENDPHFYRAMCKWAKDYSLQDKVWPYMEMNRMQKEVNPKNLQWIRILANDFND